MVPRARVRTHRNELAAEKQSAELRDSDGDHAQDRDDQDWAATGDQAVSRRKGGRGKRGRDEQLSP